MLVPGGMVLRSSSQESESMEFIPGNHREINRWLQEILSNKEK